MLSGCLSENMNTFLIMAHSTGDRQAFLSTLCKIIMDLFNFSPPDGSVLQFREEDANSDVL